MKRLKGINRDTNPMDQPAGSYRYAKNIIIDKEKFCLSSEEGDKLLVAKSTEDSVPVGYIVLADDRIVVFTEDSPANNNSSSIGIYNPLTQVYTVLFNDNLCTVDNKLNFTTRFPIEGEFKIDATDEITIYFTDDNNPPRYMSLNNPPVASNILDIQTTFNLFPTLSRYPKLLLNKVVAGGTLNVGTYYITCQLVTTDGATTNFLDVSNPIYINGEAEGLSTVDFGPASGYGVNSYSGATSGTSSGKKIVMDVYNIDALNYSFIRPIVISKIGSIFSAVALPDISLGTTTINPVNLNINYTGFESASTVNMSDIQIPRASYAKAKTIAQVDDVLYLGNLVRTKVDVGYQKYANSIKIQSKQLGPNGEVGTAPNYSHNTSSEPVTPYIDATLGTITKSTAMDWTFGRNAHDNYYFKGYERDEVYAFYIVWILKDGSESMAYHIPGRAPISVANPLANGQNEDQRVNTNTSYQSYIGTLAATNIVYGDTANKPFMFQLTTEGAYKPGGNMMGYWQNNEAGQVYPATSDYDIWTVDANGNSVQSAGTLQGEKIRHHHFPAESTVDPGIRNSTRQPQGGGLIWDGGNHQGTNFSFVRFNPLGFEASNIPFPAEIKELVLGYKIYYANRTSENATVIDHGIVHNTGYNKDEGTGVRYHSPYSHIGEQNSDPTSLAFDGFHTLTTGDSVEPVSAFKPTRVQTIGGISAANDGTFFAKGVSFHAENHLGADKSSTRAVRSSIDWTRCRPVDYYGDSHQFSFGSVDLKYIPDIVSSSVTRLTQVSPIKTISYLQAGGVNSSTFPGLTVDNDRTTQTIHIQLEDNYSIQSYGGFFHDSNTGLNFQTNDFTGNGMAQDGNSFNQTNLEVTSNTQTGLLDPFFQAVINRFHFGGVFGNLYSFKDDVYVDFTDQSELVYTGFFRDTTDIAPQLLGSTGAIMGGDTFMGMVAINKRQTFTHVGDNEKLTAGWMLSGITFNGAGIENDGFVFNTHIFPTTSRSHIAMRTFEVDDTASYFFPAVAINHEELINQNSKFLRDYAFNDDFNAENTIKILNVFNTNNPLSSIEDFPTRIARSIKFNQSGMTDNFRVFLAGQYRDLPRHRGELWRLETIKSLLLPHMEKSLMTTQGKEQLSVGAVAASLGSGDLFERDPMEVITTERGEAGTRSQWGAAVSRNGYFFTDTSSAKVYLYTGKDLEEVSSYGLKTWFKENMINPLTKYGLPENIDIPSLSVGASCGYDPVHDRYILTYKYLQLKDTPAALAFDSNLTNDLAGYSWNKENRYFDYGETIIKLDDSIFDSRSWTVSYYPSLKAWGSFHDYNPNFYAYTSKDIYKIYGRGGDMLIARPDHERVTPAAKFINIDNNDSTNEGVHEVKDIHFEFIDNTSPVDNKLFSSINWVVDVENPVTLGSTEVYSSSNQAWLHNAGFTNLFVYNSYQMSKEKTITILPNSLNGNCRRLDRGWHFNDFRDDSVLTQNAAGTNLSSQSTNMFIYDGMDIIQNTAFLSAGIKTFDKRKKFVDKFVGIRLSDKSSSNQRNFISLYLADTSKRKVYR